MQQGATQPEWESFALSFAWRNTAAGCDRNTPSEDGSIRMDGVRGHQTLWGMTDMQEESKITAMGDRSNANWGINPDLEELRSYARIVVDILSGDCLTELRLAAMSDSKKSVIGA